MDEKNTMVQILIYMQKKYNKMNEILSITKDMEEVLRRNDEVSLRLILSMRHECMMEIDKFDAAIKILEQALKSNIPPVEEYSLNDENLVAEFKEKIKRILSEVIRIDKVLNKKIGGTKAFYNE